jgi:predicted O-methyltransferase YrrM
MHQYSPDGHLGLPQGWFYPAEIEAYRALATPIKNGLIVEVGVFLGRSICAIAPICKANNTRLVGIDPWFGNDQQHAQCLQNLARFHGENVEIWRRPSLEAVGQFADDSLDLAFVDGDHSFDAVMADLRAWSAKVKPGGVIAGHDFGEFHGAMLVVDTSRKTIPRAVQEVFGPGNYVLGGSVWGMRLTSERKHRLAALA